MIKYCFILLLLFPLVVQCQTKSDGIGDLVRVNYTNIDTSDVEVNAVVKVWTSYLKSRIYGWILKNDTLGFNAWNNEERESYPRPDFVFSIFPALFFFHTAVLNIEPVDHNYYRILNCNSVADSTGNVQIKAIYYVLAGKTEGEYKLFNYFYHEKEKLKTTDVGKVQYYYPGYYPFSNEKARKFVEFQDSLSILFNQPVIHKLTYIFDTNTVSLMNRIGFIYQPMLPGAHDGRYITDDYLLLSASDENHRHELVHYFTSLENPDHILLFDEGLATCLGGNKGHDLKWHANNLYQYFIHEMHSDTSKIMGLDSMSKITDPLYVKGAIIMKYAIDKYGFQKALTLLSYPENKYTPEDVIAKELGIPRLQLNSFLLEYMKKYAGL